MSARDACSSTQTLGFRIDAAKHMPASAWTSIMNAVRATYPTTRQGEAIWLTQEIINDGEVDRGSYLPIGTINEFQFTYAMREVFRGLNGTSLSSIPGIPGIPGSDVADPACRPHSMRRGARMTVVRQANSLK